MGISNSEHSEANAAPSARAFELAKNTPSGLLVGPRRRALSGTMSRRRTVAWRLRVNPVSLLMMSVRTPCDMSRRASSDRRFSRRIGSSEISGLIHSPRSRHCDFSEKAAKCSYQLFVRQCTIPIRFSRNKLDIHEMIGLRRAAMTPSRWAGMRLLPTAHRLNERCFSLLAETVRKGAGLEQHGMYGLRELWAQVDARVCERAGRCPVLLMDLNFQRADWWVVDDN